MSETTVTVYGASDDLIEIEGALSEEFYAYGDEEPSYLGFSDGTCLSVVYDVDGIWRINRVVAGTASYSKTEATDASSDDYSDRVTLAGEFAWVVRGKDIAKGVVRGG